MSVSALAAWWFLGVALWGALLVANAVRPFHFGPRSAFLSFFVGWLVGELAPHHVFWQGLASAGFVAFGALEHPAGQLALAVAVAQWLVLGWHYARGARTGRVVERALADGLGEDWERTLPAPEREALTRDVDWSAIAFPFPIRRNGVERVRNVTYARVGGRPLRLDVYRERGMDPGERRPVFFYVHGGAWVIGTKNTQGLPLCIHLARRGFVCVNVNYRLSPRATFPDHLVDLKRALAWVREDGLAYGCDPDFVATAGGSAGGHLASLLALTSADRSLQPGFEDANTSVQACVPIYGVYDWRPHGSTWRERDLLPFLEQTVLKARYADAPERFEAGSPMARIGPDAPPFLVVHGDADSLVPVAEAREFAERLREGSPAPAAYVEVPGGQHAFELFPALRSDLARRGIEHFLVWARWNARKASVRAA